MSRIALLPLSLAICAAGSAVHAASKCHTITGFEPPLSIRTPDSSTIETRDGEVTIYIGPNTRGWHKISFLPLPPPPLPARENGVVAIGHRELYISYWGQVFEGGGSSGTETALDGVLFRFDNKRAIARVTCSSLDESTSSPDWCYWELQTIRQGACVEP